MEHTTRLLGHGVITYRRFEFYLLWTVATLVYGVGDILTTLYFLTYDVGIVEGNQIVALVVEHFGHGGFVGMKLVIFMFALAISVIAAEYWNDRLMYYGPPLILILLGSIVTINNLHLLSITA